MFIRFSVLFLWFTNIPLFDFQSTQKIYTYLVYGHQNNIKTKFLVHQRQRLNWGFSHYLPYAFCCPLIYHILIFSKPKGPHWIKLGCDNCKGTSNDYQCTAWIQSNNQISRAFNDYTMYMYHTPVFS